MSNRPSPPLPEWAPHEAVWIGFPSDPELWLGDLKPAEREVAAFAAAVHAGARARRSGWSRRMTARRRRARGCAPFAEVIVEPFGDIWLRDTGPIVLGSGKDRRAQGFGFNGWGGKYDLDGDQDIGERLALHAGLPFAKADWVLEGGAIDGDGSGTVLTTEQCLLNPNRNTPDPRRDRAAAARRPRVRARGLVRLRADERPYRRPYRQSRAVRRAGAGGDPDLPRRTTPTKRSTRTPPGGSAMRSSTSSPCPRPAASPTRTATSSRRAT